jgi:hypothetical protein
VVSGLPDVLPVGSFFMSLSPWATPIAPPGFPSASRELEVRDLRGPDGPHKLEPVRSSPTPSNRRSPVPRNVGTRLISISSTRPARRYCWAALAPPVSLLFSPSRCLEELRPLVKRLGHGSEQHPAWTNVFRVECQTQGAGRPR